jgi:hypothetical protein
MKKRQNIVFLSKKCRNWTVLKPLATEIDNSIIPIFIMKILILK